MTDAVEVLIGLRHSHDHGQLCPAIKGTAADCDCFLRDSAERMVGALAVAGYHIVPLTQAQTTLEGLLREFLTITKMRKGTGPLIDEAESALALAQEARDG